MTASRIDPSLIRTGATVGRSTIVPDAMDMVIASINEHADEIDRGMYKNVLSYGAAGDGIADDTAAIQAAINADAGRVTYLPKGKYKVTTTLQINNRLNRIVGDACSRNNIGGTEITFYGSGALFQIGTDNGHPWDAADYDGPQDQWWENIWLSYATPDTALSNGNGSYKPGTYAIRDWRAGGIRLYNVGMEQFEYNFWGIQSDINDFRNVTSIYSKSGIYLGPRSDQNSIQGLYSYFCDRMLVIDAGVRQARIEDAQIVGCGTATLCPIEIYKGASSIRIVRPWFEHLQGYNGTDQAGFVAIGLTNGYNNETRAARKVVVDSPLVYTTATGQAYHSRCVIRLGAGYDVALTNPAAPVGNSDSLNVEAFILAPSGTSETAGTAFARLVGVDASIATAQFWKNEGSGTPGITYIADFGPGPGQTFYVPAGYQQTMTGMVVTTDGVSTKPVAGAVSDGSFIAAPTSGLMGIDTTNSRLFVRVGSNWKFTPMTGSVETKASGALTPGIQTTWITTSGTAAYTLADGDATMDGLVHRFVVTAATSTPAGTLTPTHLADGSSHTITWSTGPTAFELIWDNANTTWRVLGTPRGATVN